MSILCTIRTRSCTKPCCFIQILEIWPFLRQYFFKVTLKRVILCRILSRSCTKRRGVESANFVKNCPCTNLLQLNNVSKNRFSQQMHILSQTNHCKIFQKIKYSRLRFKLFVHSWAAQKIKRCSCSSQTVPFASYTTSNLTAKTY